MAVLKMNSVPKLNIETLIKIIIFKFYDKYIKLRHVLTHELS